jgi:hypothetical protein
MAIINDQSTDSDLAGNNMNVPTRSLAILALAALIPLTALIFYLDLDDPEEGLAVIEAAVEATIIEPLEMAQTTAVPAPEPVAQVLASTPELEPEHIAAINTVSEQLSQALTLLNTQQQMLESQSKKLDTQTDSLNSHIARMQRMEATLDELQGKATLAATGIDVIGPGSKDDTQTPIDTSHDVSDVSDASDVSSIANAAANANAIANSTQSSQVQGDAAVEKEQQDDPTRVILNSLPGAMRLPGTNTVMKWGGYVKSTVVKSFDPIGSDDRFITGEIPVTATEGFEEQTSLSVNQSRLNLDMREPTSVGLLRAFVEGDFAASGETFRLRHAFGQRGNVLAGQTWSGFVDRSSSPEEVDFEGLNGRINVRQPQFRFQPGFGRKYEMAISLEDPSPEVTNGSGVSQVPDFVISGRVNLRNNFHTRLALLLRQVRAQPDSNPDDVAKEYGYALQLSSKIDVPLFDQRDKIMFQLNAGKGYGRYVNDLNSVGNFDGIFDANGNLELIDVFSGYVSAQHWWRGSLRSNLTLGYVELNNPNFVDDTFYKRTIRLSGNLFWSPTPRFDLGGELLWGEKETEDGEQGSATQFQFAARYLF